METLVNLGTNPSAEVSTAGWVGTLATLTQDGAWSASGSKSFKVTPTGGGAASDMRAGSPVLFPFGMAPGRTYSISATMRLAAPQLAGNDARARAIMMGYSLNGSSYTTSYSPKGPNVGGAATVSAMFTVPANATGVVLILGAGSNNAADAIWWDNVSIVESPVPVGYFDGDAGRVAIPGSLDWYVHSWVGTPGLSASTRTRMAIQEWTHRWWGLIPSAYREIDAGMNADIGGFPLLRFMDGPGQVAGEVRDLSDLMWSGDFTDPETVPDYAIRWLAQMLGVPKAQRELDAATLRAYLVDLVTQGRPAAGNRQSIALAAKRFLTGDRQTIVQPSTVADHTILVLVRADEVPNNDTALIAAGIRAAGVIPAGHDLQVVLAQATWDSWEAAAGVTWTELEGKATTWAKGDSLGIVLE